MSTGTLWGIGVGPGDPRELTLRAVDVLTACAVVAVPRVVGSAVSGVGSIVRPHLEAAGAADRLAEFPLPVSDRHGELAAALDATAEHLAGHLAAGRDVAYCTLGHPLLYSTFPALAGRVAERLPAVRRAVVSGVSSPAAAAARLADALASGRQRLAVVPVGDDLSGLDAVLTSFDAVVLLKVDRAFGRLVDCLDAAGRLADAVLLSRVGRPDEEIVHDLRAAADAPVDYLSLVLVRRPDGGRLSWW